MHHFGGARPSVLGDLSRSVFVGWRRAFKIFLRVSIGCCGGRDVFVNHHQGVFRIDVGRMQTLQAQDYR